MEQMEQTPLVKTAADWGDWGEPKVIISKRGRDIKPLVPFLRESIDPIQKAPRFMVSCTICGNCQQNTKRGAIYVNICNLDGTRVMASVLRFCDNFCKSSTFKEAETLKQEWYRLGYGGWVDSIRLVRFSFT